MDDQPHVIGRYICDGELCEWCGEVMSPSHVLAKYDGDIMHLHCAAEALDEDTGLWEPAQ